MDNSAKIWLNDARLDTRFLAADRALCKRREERRIDRERSPVTHSSDNSRVTNTLAYRLGKGRVRGGVVECGRYIELYLTEEIQHYGMSTTGVKSERNKTAESRQSIARRVNHRARKQIRRLINANDLRGMITLTMALPSADNDAKYNTVSQDNQRDYEYVRRLYKMYVQRVKRRYPDWRYVVVFEWHDSERTSDDKRYTWHCHIACDARDDRYEAERALWKHGLTDYQDYRYDKQGNLRDKEICNPGAYIAEYIGKEGAQFGSRSLVHKRRYTTSRNIVKPVRVRLDNELGVDGNFERLVYKGHTYVNEYYISRQVPGTQLLRVSATYRRV